MLVLFLVCTALVMVGSIGLRIPSAWAGTDDYPAQWRNVPQDSLFDTWKELNRECTSFVAWRLHSRNGFEMPFFDDAVNLGPTVSRLGYTVDSTPMAGSVAWSGSGGGHVAWVETVSGSTVTIEDYNSDFTGHYGESVVAAGTYQYIHFKDLPSTPPPPPVPAGYPPIPGTGDLARYNGPEHVSLTWGAPANYHLEMTLGRVYKIPVAGTHPIYLCRIGGDNFTSTQSGCEGQTGIGLLGFLYDSPSAASLPTIPVVRCSTWASGEHFDSNDPGCEGQHIEYTLGYAIGQADLARYTGPEHVSLTWGAPANYHLEMTLGVLYKIPVVGTHPIYLCRIGGDNFTSTQSGCEGQTGIGLLGFLYDSPSAASLPTIPVVRCSTWASGEHFDSNDPGCEGQHIEYTLGYAIGQADLARYTGPEHVSLTWGAPANYHLEMTLGVLYKIPVAGTHPIYLCRIGGDNFTSTQSGCEGQTGIGLLGFLYDSPSAASLPTIPVVRCSTWASGEHFDSNDPGCEGQHIEYTLGYAIGQ